MNRYTLILLMLFHCLSQNSYGQNDWTRFRGPNGAGISMADSIPTTWTDKDYNWRVDVPGIGHSSPVVWKDRIFTTSADPNTGQQSVLCLHSSDGRTLWRKDFESETFAQHPGSSYADATPAVDQHGVVAMWTTPATFYVVSLDLGGKEKWRRDLGPFIGPNGGGVSPIIADDLVIISNDQDDVQLLTRLSGGENPEAPIGKSALIALDRTSGKVRWQLPRKTVLASYATPCVRQTEDGSRELILASTAQGISGVDLTTGRLKWEIRDLFEDRCVGSPILAGELVIAGFGRGVSGELCVAARAGKSGVGDEATLAYSITRAVPLVPSTLYVNGLLFLWADNGVVSCLDAKTGEVHWRQRVKGNFYGSPVCVGQHLYCIAKDGDVVVLSASSDFRPVSRVPLGQDSFTTPAVSDGVMYLRTASRLFSLGTP